MTQNYNVNPDGSFMSAPQILADIANTRITPDLKHLLAHDFKPPRSADEERAFQETHFDVNAYARTAFGRWIRNSYGLWDPKNPHTMMMHNGTQVIEGIDHHPCHPDNFSGEIIDRLVDYIRPTSETKAA